jgi:hypothetical protein
MMFQKSRLHSRANIHTFSAVLGYFFLKVMALNTHWQKEDGSLGGQPERNKVYRNKA